MNKENIKAILDRYHHNEATEEDLIFLEDWYVWHVRQTVSNESYGERELLEDTAKVWENLNDKPVKALSWIPYAAAILLVGLLLITYFKFTSNYDKPNFEALVNGKGQPQLILSDGRVFDLDTSKSALQISQEIQYTDGTIVHQSKEQNENLMITVPLGQIFHFALADGTKVWLNAKSKLHFPSRFDSSDDRMVELEGEGYFEVTKDKRSFKVQSNDHIVKVLGTHFNVKAYPDETNWTTTLLEGKVEIRNGKETRILNPGLQAIGSKNSEIIQVKKADLGTVLSWRSGSYDFQDASIQEVMKVLARWYPIEVQYENNLSGIQFGGKLSNSKTLEELLYMLESTGDVRFKIQESKKHGLERRVIVTK